MRKLMWFTIGFVMACIIGVYFWCAWLWLLIPGAAALFVGMMIAKRWVKHLRIVAAVSLGFAIGLSWFLAFDDLFLTFPKEADGQSAKVSMTVADYSVASRYGLRTDADMYLDGKVYKLRVYLNDFEKGTELKPGDRISGLFRFRMTLRGGSEDPTYHSGDGIYLLAYQDGDIQITHSDSLPARYYPVTWKQNILNRIDELFPADTAGFAKALLLGERSDIDYETNTALKTTGISHIIAVSGLHVSMLIMLLYFIMGRHTHWPTIIGIPLLLGFAAMVGFTPSVTRACIMQMIMMIGWSAFEEYDPPTSLATAVLIMLIANPMTIISVSFQLSVGCIIGILAFSGPISNWLYSPKVLGSGEGRGLKPKLKRGFVASVSITLSANVITIPLVAYYFGNVSLVGLLTNLLVLWAISIIFNGIIFACSASLIFMEVGVIIAAPISFLIRFVTVTAKTIGKIPYAAVYTQSNATVVWLVVCYVLLGVFLLLKKKRVWLLCTGMVSTLCIALFISWYIPARNTFSVTVLDVGQGQSIILQSKAGTYLVDCGGDTNADCANIAAEYLLSQGIFKLDGVILTHYDVDHYGGIAMLLTRIEAPMIYMPMPSNEDADLAASIADSVNCQVTYVNFNISFVSDSTKMQIFAPPGDTNGNDCSICVLFQAENCDILITGDRNRIGEELLMEHVDLPELEILVAGHHGSKHSTSEELLDMTKPEYVFISAGKDNSYGHPSPELLERLNTYGCKVYCTADMGNIVFRGR